MFITHGMKAEKFIASAIGDITAYRRRKQRGRYLARGVSMGNTRLVPVTTMRKGLQQRFCNPL